MCNQLCSDYDHPMSDYEYKLSRCRFEPVRYLLRNKYQCHCFLLACVHVDLHIAGFKRATDECSLPLIPQYSQHYLPLNMFTASKRSNFYILLELASWSQG